jgi:hypothetical protein
MPTSFTGPERDMRPFLLALLALLATASCAKAETMDQPTITEQHAVARIEQLIRGAVAVLNPAPELELHQPSRNNAPCLNPSDGGSEDRIIVNRQYYLRGVPKERLSEAARAMQAHWEAEGHVITSSSGFDRGAPNVSGRSRPDDFLISVSWTEGDHLGVEATSPCIWRNGTP